MRRWAIVVIVAIVLLMILPYLRGLPGRIHLTGLVAVLVFYSMVLIPGIIYWERMTW